MLSKYRRLRAQEVAEVIKKGRSLRANHLSAKFLSAQGGLRSAVVVPKSLARLAVKRNKLRRALYRTLSSNSSSKISSHIVFFLRTIPKEDAAGIYREEIAFILSKIN